VSKTVVSKITADEIRTDFGQAGPRWWTADFAQGGGGMYTNQVFGRRNRDIEN